MTKIIQDEAEFSICLETVRRLKARSILEIGSAYGGTIAKWLETGVEHVVSLDISHDAIDHEYINRHKKPGQTVTLLTGSSLEAETIARLDETRQRLGIDAFDVCFIDGAHHYMAVKMDFATCLTRSKQLIIFNDSVLRFVQDFLNELQRSHHKSGLVNIVNPNRRLPCPPGQCTCDSDYAAETGAGNMLMFLEPGGEVEDWVREETRRALAPIDPLFEPTRKYFHHRGLRESPSYAAFWQNRLPVDIDQDSFFFRDSNLLYREARRLHLDGFIEESVSLLRKADKVREQWPLFTVRRLLKRARGKLKRCGL